MTWKIGLHNTAVGAFNGIEQYRDAIRAANIPIVCVQTDADNILRMMQENGRPEDILVYRRTGDLEQLPDNRGIPPPTRYIGHPESIAEQRMNTLIEMWPAFLNPQHVYMTSINEPSKEPHDTEFLARYELRCAEIALAENRRYLTHGWAAGTPEIDWWDTQWGRQTLQLIGSNPHLLGVRLHEYSLHDDIQHIHPWLVGRHQFLFQFCADNNIPLPTTIIGECGWHHDSIPKSSEEFIADILWLQGLYAQHPNIKGVALWTLGQWDGSVINDMIRLIPDLIHTAVNYAPANPPPPPPPPDPPKTLSQHLWDVAHEHSPANFGAALQIHILNYQQPPEPGFRPFGQERWTSYANTDYAVQAAVDWHTEQRAVFYCIRPHWQDYSVIFHRDASTEFSLINPLHQPMVITSVFNAHRDYSGYGGKANDFHEGLDLRAAVGDPVMAAAGGIVEALRHQDTGGYGRYVRIRTVTENATYRIWYTHLNAVYATLNQNLHAGQVLGTAGMTGNTDGPHLHLTIQKEPGGLPNYIVPNVMDPAPPLGLPPTTRPGPPAPTPPPPTGRDMVPYFSPPIGEAFGDIVILTNNWGQHSERCQLQQKGNWLENTKNRQFERRILRQHTIDLLLDTSPSDDQYYTVSGPWLARVMTPGEVFTRTEVVQYFYKANCQPIGGPHTWTTNIRFVAHHPTFQPQDGIAVLDVIELAWEINGIIDERYFYARHKGLVAWVKNDGRRSYITELIPRGTQHNNDPDYGCWG